MRVILNTVGTSVLTNYLKAQSGGGASAQGEKKGEGDLRQGLVAYINEMTTSEKRDLTSLSAEIKSLAKLGVGPEDYLYFLCTDTAEGLLCGEQVANLCRVVFQTQGNEIYQIPGLQVNDKEEFTQKGIPNLVAKILDLLDRHGWYNCILNPTGGFKAVVPYTTMIGLVFGLDIFYIFEHSEQLIKLPGAPLEMDEDLFAPLEPVLEKIDNDYLSKDDFLAQTGIPHENLERFTALLSEEDGFITLSPLGRLFYRRWQKTKLYQVELSLEVKKKMASKRYDRGVFEAIFRKMRDRVHLMAKLHNEVKGKNVDCDCYKGGNTNERVFFYLESNTVKVCDIFLHNDYDYELKKGQILRKNYHFSR